MDAAWSSLSSTGQFQGAHGAYSGLRLSTMTRTSTAHLATYRSGSIEGTRKLWAPALDHMDCHLVRDHPEEHSPTYIEPLVRPRHVQFQHGLQPGLSFQISQRVKTLVEAMDEAWARSVFPIHRNSRRTGHTDDPYARSPRHLRQHLPLDASKSFNNKILTHQRQGYPLHRIHQI